MHRPVERGAKLLRTHLALQPPVDAGPGQLPTTVPPAARGSGPTPAAGRSPPAWCARAGRCPGSPRRGPAAGGRGPRGTPCGARRRLLARSRPPNSRPSTPPVPRGSRRSGIFQTLDTALQVRLLPHPWTPRSRMPFGCGSPNSCARFEKAWARPRSQSLRRSRPPMSPNSSGASKYSRSRDFPDDLLLLLKDQLDVVDAQGGVRDDGPGEGVLGFRERHPARGLDQALLVGAARTRPSPACRVGRSSGR